MFSAISSPFTKFKHFKYLIKLDIILFIFADYEEESDEEGMLCIPSTSRFGKGGAR